MDIQTNPAASMTAPFAERYDNFIGGKWVAPKDGRCFDNISPITGKVVGQVARSQGADIEAALDAAHAARDAWGRTSVGERALILNRIADRMEENLEKIAIAETWDNGKPLRETMAADIPLAIDHFRYFAGCIRAQEGGISEIDHDTVAYHFHEPLGVVGQIIPWNFPILMAVWKLAPALAAGNCVVLKPAEQTPASIMVLMELIGDLLPAGVVNVVNGFGVEAGKPLASSSRIAKIAFTGETSTGRLIMQYATENLIPVTLELGGKSPNIFFEDVCREDDDYLDKAIEGFVMFALNQGEICTCPSRALVHESKRLTGGVRGALVTAVSEKAFEQAVGMVGRGGTLALNGLPPGDFPLNIFGMVLNGITVRGSIVGTRLDLQESLDFAGDGKVNATISTAGLDDINAVFDRMRQGQIEGRVVLDMTQ